MPEEKNGKRTGAAMKAAGGDRTSAVSAALDISAGRERGLSSS